MMSLRSMKSIQHTLKSTEELSLGSMSFELSYVVAHHTETERGSLNLYAPLWKQVIRLLWIPSEEQMSLNIFECKLCRLISHSTGLIRKMHHLLERTKEYVDLCQTLSRYPCKMLLLHLVSYISVKHSKSKKKQSHLINFL